MTVRSIERALKILMAFSLEDSELTLTDLCNRLQLSPSTIHRLLGTLEAFGFVERVDNTNNYRLGRAVFQLGLIVQQSMDLRKQSEAPLKQLAEQTNETAYLCVLDGDEALCLHRVECRNPVKVLALDIGGRLPLNCGAAPRALLASMPDEEIRRLTSEGAFKKLTPSSITEPYEIWNDVASTRQQGYIFSVEDVLEGVAAVGAPVRNHNGQIVGAVSIAGILPHFDHVRLPRLIRAVVNCSETISRNLGWVAANQQPVLTPEPDKVL
jgi:IclR family transcriptional regulator, KDG regulon repressor